MDKSKWEYKKLGDCCKVINGLWVGKKPPFINVGVIRNANFTKACELDTSNIAFIEVEKKAFEQRKLIYGDIIIEKSGGSDKQPVGRPVLFNLNGDFSFSNFTSALRIENHKDLDSNYLYKYLKYVYFSGATRAMQSNTTGLHNLDFTKYKSLLIPIAPLSDQQQIVAELDCLNEMIAVKQEQLKEFDKLAQSIFYDMFGDPVSNEKGWQTYNLGDLGVLARGVSKHRPRNAPELLGGTMPLIQTGDVANAEMYIKNYASTYSDLGVAQSKVWDAGTLCITIAATIGKCAILSFEACFPDSVVGFLAECSKTNNIYMYFIFKRLQKILEMNAPAVAQKNINLAVLNALQIPLPPLELQQQFADKISAIEAQKELVKQSIAETQKLLDYTMDKYFG